MARRAPSAPRGALLVGLLVAPVLLASCGGYGAGARGAYDARATPTYAPSHPSVAEQQTTLDATEGYRRFLLTSAERLTSELEALAADARADDLAGARTSELAAQVDFDALRGDVAPDSAVAIQLDGEAWSIGASPFGGLHRIERELWGPVDLTAAGQRAEGLASLSEQVAFVLYRAVLTPAEMLAQAQVQLEWAVDVPLGGREELYSHHDLADVAAAIGAARTAFVLVAPLGRLVASAAVTRCARRFASLDATLRRLGPPASRSDASVTASTWASIAESAQSANGALGALDGDVQGFGSGRLYA
jgi:hypothetical protein